MNLSFRLINPQANRSYIFKWEPLNLAMPWHYHPELELIYFTEGKVSTIIGNGFRDFEEGDLILLGSNFPHVLKENLEFKASNPATVPFGLVIQFLENFLGNDFLEKPETKKLRRLFDHARRGLFFKRKVIENVAETLKTMHQYNEMRQLAILIDVLFTLAETTDYEYMTNQDYHFQTYHDEERLTRINQFVYEKFSEKITIADAAAIANMSETAFCRYFKSRTFKTFTHFLNEVRIAHACKILAKSSATVSEACYQSGFNSLSYFNRQFKTIMRISPQKYNQ